MAMKLRVEYPGAIYYVMNRGDRREEIFSPIRIRNFLEIPAKACGKAELTSVCLLPYAESFSPGDQGAPSQSRFRHEVISRHVHRSFQPAPQAIGPFIQWPLQIPDHRRLRQWISELNS